jgi:hypothetical protein
MVTHNIKGDKILDDSAPAPFKCSFCNSTFIKTSYLAKHTEKYHKKYECRNFASAIVNFCSALMRLQQIKQKYPPLAAKSVEKVWKL